MKSKRTRKLQHIIETIALRFALICIWIIPYSAVVRAGESLGRFVFSVLKIRKRVVLNNLSIAFPEKTTGEQLLIARRAYQFFGRSVFEFIHCTRRPAQFVRSLYTIEGEDCLRHAVQRGRGGLVLSGHFGNWEIIGHVVSGLGYPLSGIARTMRNKTIDRLLSAYRTSMGLNMIPLGISVREMIRRLKNNEFILVLSDQNAGRGGVFVDFFRQKASTPQGAAVISLKMGVPIIFLWVVRLSTGKYRINFKEVDIDHIQGLSQENVFKVTQIYTRLLEEAIRRHPDHYFWMHRRWKSKISEILTTEVNSD